MRRAAAAVAAIVASVALVAHGGVMTDASWNDLEFAHGAVGTLDCTAGAFATRGEGRLLSGSLLGVGLDRVAEVGGMVVTNDGSRSRPDPASAAPAGPDAYADPLSVEALSAVNVSLPGVLQLPLDTDLGLVGQYAQAGSDGTAVGAAGALTSSGGIALDRHGEYPELARLSVSQLLAHVDPTSAAALGNVTDVSLVAGAMTGRAQVDGCALAWSGAASAIDRDYLAASLRTDIESPTVGALVRGVSGAIDSLESAVTRLGSDDGVISGITSGLIGLVDRVLVGSNVGSIQVRGDIGFAAVRSITSGSFGDEGGVVTVDPTAGTISVDTTALLAAAYPSRFSDGLNGLPPNTDVLSDPAIMDALTVALRTAATEWITDVEAALVTAIDSVRVSASAQIGGQLLVAGLVPVWVPVTIDVEVDDVTLADLRTRIVPATASLVLGAADAPLAPVVRALLAPVLDTLTADFGRLVGIAVDGVLSPFASLTPAVEALADPIVAAVSTVYSTLFVSELVSVTVNAQNDPADRSTEPRDWSTMPDGRYDVAALRIGVLDALGAHGVQLYLGRGSVGPGCVLAEAPLPCAGY